MRYAQAKAGQKLHLVFVVGQDRVSSMAICGKRANWRMTINVPLGKVCRKCIYASDKRIDKVRRYVAENIDPINFVT